MTIVKFLNPQQEKVDNDIEVIVNKIVKAHNIGFIYMR